jgi:hypothetical protein
MAERVEIQCITKRDRQNPHERIESVGGRHNGKPWTLAEDRAIAGVENGTWSFWTKGGGRVANVVVAKHLGRKYLKTEADGVEPYNLLALAACPV